MKGVNLAAALLLLFIWSSVNSQLDDDIEKLKNKISGNVYLPGSQGFSDNTGTLYPNFNKKPKLVVVVDSVEDVSQAVMFADKFNLSTRVMSSGHDFNGRNTDNDILQLNLKRLNKITVNDGAESAWVDTACHWGKVYEEVDKYNKLAVGGSAHTVCPGGYIAGGGHSPMSPYLGLGVDHVLTIEMVAMDGRIMKVYKDTISTKSGNGTWEDESDADLFWALRGGGGGTFGIVTGYEIKLHDPPPEGFVHLIMVYPIRHETYGTFGEKLLEFYSNELLNKLIKAKWGGYLLINTKVIQASPKVTGTITFFLLRPGSWAEAYESVSDLYNFEPDWLIYKDIKNVTTFWEYSKNVTDETGFRTAVANSLFQMEDFVNPKWKDILKNMLDFEMEMTCTGANLGGQVNVPSKDSASISPDLRSAWMSFSCGAGWIEAKHDKDVFNIVHRFGNQLTSLMGKGVYLNEPDYYLEDWKEQFWGDTDRYEKLLSIKKKWDQKSLLKCHHCVGDDASSLRAQIFVILPLFFTLASLEFIIA